VNLEDLLDAWRANEAANLELLALCADEDFELKPGKGKTIRSNFTHLVSVRRMWLEDKMKAAAAAIPKLDWKSATREEIVGGLDVSGQGMLAYFAKRAEPPSSGGWTLMKFFAYAIAHEAHHRSQVEIALRINGKEPEEKALYGLWEWGGK
jgi:uncharacterized damage-inducible protein DinB